MKIDVSRIAIDHFDTLRREGSNRPSISDISIFFGLPVVIALTAWIFGLSVANEFYNVLVAFFGIFIGLLINIQIVTFGIFQRPWRSVSDARTQEMQDEEIETRRELLAQSNANISYLVLICCAACCVALISYAASWKSGVAPALCVLLISHFFLTLLMIVKRIHALFSKEYMRKQA